VLRVGTRSAENASLLRTDMKIHTWIYNNEF